MVKAMAPKAPSGAARTTIFTTPKKISPGLVDGMAGGQPRLFRQGVDGEAGQHRQQQHLQQLALGEGAEEGVGDDRHADAATTLSRLRAAG